MYYYNTSVSEQLTQGKFDYEISNEYHYILIGDTTVSQLKKAAIIPNKNYTGFFKNKPDGLILFGKNNVKVLIEYKKPGTFQTLSEAQKLISDWYYGLSSKLNCNVICITDGVNSFWIYAPLKKEIKYSDGGSVNFIFDSTKFCTSNQDYTILLTRLLEELEYLDKTGIIKKPIEHNPQNLAKNVWQKIWITTGKQPEQCLYNVVEIFVFKYLSDLSILDADYSFDKIYRKSESNPEDALMYYADNVRPRIKMRFPKGEDGTTIINGTIFVNEHGKANTSKAILFKEVLKEFYNYGQEFGSFIHIDKNFKTRLYENFLRRTAGISSMGQYFTPRNVVRSIISMAKFHQISESASICDPFCGVGGFLLEFLNENTSLKEQYIPQNGKINSKFTLIGYDKGSDEKDDQRTIILAKANMLIYLSDIISQYPELTDLFAREVFNTVFHLKKSNLGTFGITTDKDRYDLIITNPPYVTSGISMINHELKESGIKDLIYPVQCRGLEGLALEWIIYSLKEGGTAFVIVPEGVLKRKDDLKLRQFILQTCTLNAVISLPTRTFFATPQDTYIISITKNHKHIKNLTDYNVLTYIVSEIGETRDANRFSLPKNDLIPASRAYRQFMSIKEEFESNDKRCKIQSVSRFLNSDWIIKTDWSENEKKELGITTSDSIISEIDFIDLITQINSEITNAKRNATKIDISGYSYKKIPLKFIGSFFKGKSKYTRSYCIAHSGIYPVYSSETKGNNHLGTIDSYDWDTECVTITTNGHYAGTPRYIKKQKFSMNNDCGCFILKAEFIDSIDYKYIEYALLNKRIEFGYNWKNKPTPDNILDLEILIPISENGNYDIRKQQLIVKKHSLYSKIKRIIETEAKTLYPINIDVIGDMPV